MEGLTSWKHTLNKFFFQPFIYLFVFGYIMGRGLPGGIFGGNYSQVVAPGILSMLVMNVALGTTGSFLISGYYFKSMEAWLLTPITLRAFMLSRVASGIVNTTIAGLGGIIIIRLMLGLFPENFWLALVFILMGGLIFSCLSLIAFTLPKTPDRAQEVLSFILMPMMFFGCTFYTYSTLPWPWNMLALLFPTTYLSEAMRAAYNPALPHMDTGLIFVGLSLGLLVIAYFADRTFHRRFKDFLW
ncbi:MAG: ABC transporter permease [Candidatus Schekmanbacteria bacterium]|nr:ABC transporter permease [Candidatus Schekmanbacteria bacterium]